MKDDGGRLKGFGYADFEDRDSLIDALSLTDACVNNRQEYRDWDYFCEYVILDL